MSQIRFANDYLLTYITGIQKYSKADLALPFFNHEDHEEIPAKLGGHRGLFQGL